MSHDKILEVSEDSFDSDVLQSEKPVLVDFWAEWCGPCRLVAPLLMEIAEENEAVRIAKLNVDEARDIAIRYGVQSIPTFILFKQGEVADRMMGAVPKSKFEEFLERNT